MNNLQPILSQSILFFILVPFLAFIVSLVFQNKQEKAIARVVLFTKAFYLLAALLFAALWIMNGRTPVEKKLLTIYQTDHFVFAIQFYYDLITAVYSIVGAILFFLVSTFSRYYMHRDEGYKRFFNTILFFALGYNLIIFSGNFETLFIGWEFIGLSSFLLIAFYRNRYLPVKNAFKVLSNYRLSDLGLILAMWMMHHLTHQNISFSQLEEAKLMAMQNDHSGMAAFIVLMILLAATIKSAQVPFTSWLPRAMEGPTTSSAIFYGSLSVHIGVFILLRTAPFWHELVWAKVAIIVIGALTAIIATMIARVQPTVKTQIAYSSAAQIGFIFIEVALGWHVFALVHFAGNAFLRTYQLLVSPSVLNYLVHHQHFHYHPPMQKLLSKLSAGFYVLGIKEWNLDGITYHFLWRPFKWLGNQFRFFQLPLVGVVLLVAAVAGLFFSISKPALEGVNETVIASVMLAIALAVILFSFSFSGSALKAWSYLLLAHLFIIGGIGLQAAHINMIEIVMYGTGILAAFALGFYCLKKIEGLDNDILLNRHHGYVYEKKYTALLFFLSSIGMLGFPITAAFIGIDVLFTYVGEQQVVSITLLALCLIFIELASIRIFLRIFLGPHKKLDHPIAFRSS